MDFRTLYAQHQRAATGLQMAKANLAEAESRCTNSARHAAMNACRSAGDISEAFHRAWTPAVLSELAVAREVHRGFESVFKELATQLATPEMMAEAVRVAAEDKALAASNAATASVVREQHAQEREAQKQGIEKSLWRANELRESRR